MGVGRHGDIRGPDDACGIGGGMKGTMWNTFRLTGKEVRGDDLSGDELELMRWARAHGGRLVLGEFLAWKHDHNDATDYLEGAP